MATNPSISTGLTGIYTRENVPKDVELPVIIVPKEDFEIQGTGRQNFSTDLILCYGEPSYKQVLNAVQDRIDVLGDEYADGKVVFLVASESQFDWGS